MKKIYGILILSICILFSLPFFATTPVFAEEHQAQISSDCSKENTKKVNRGMAFDVPIYIDNNLGLTGLMLVVTYDNTDDNIRLTGVTKNEDVKDFSLMTSGDVMKSDNISTFNLVFYSNDPYTQNQLLATLHFVSSISAPLGDYNINISYDADNTRKSVGVPATVEITSPVITLTNGKFIVEWQDWNGTVLKTQEYNAQPGEVLVPPANPTREEDGCYSYTFAKWSDQKTVGENKIVYTAEYDKTPQTHWVFYYVDGYDAEDSLYKALECTYDTTPELQDFPTKENHTFYGWYTDEQCTNKFTGKMPGEDLYLYGYLKYNIREDEYPKIQLKYIETVNNVAKISVVVTENVGFNSMKLTLDETCINSNYFTLVDFKRSTENFVNMSFTYSGGQVGTLPYSFLWEDSSANTYETGEILTLYFQVNNNTPKGVYPATLTYNYKSDVTYFKEDTTLWYSLLEIVGAEVPVGTKTNFEDEVDGTNIKLIANSDKEITYNVYMVIEDVTTQMIEKLGADNITKALGNNMTVSKIYSIYFIQNGERFTPDATMTYTLNLTEAEKLASKLELYKVVDKTITSYSSQVSGGNITFTSDETCEWLIAENKTTGTGGIGNISFNAMLMIIMLCSDVLAGALIVLAKNYKTKKLNSQGGIK